MRYRLIPSSLQSRLLLTYMILVLLGLGGLILWTGLRLQTAVVEQAEHDLELQTLIIANALREPLGKLREGEGARGRSLDALVRSFAYSVGARVTVVEPSLQVMLSSDDVVPIHFEKDHPEIVAAGIGDEQHDIRWDEWRNEERLFVAAPIQGEESLEGIVQLSVPMVPLYAEIRRTWLSLLAAAGAVLAATALVSLVLARQLAGPIRSLTAVTEAVASGHLDQQVVPAGPDEIERLGWAFNRMAEQVREMLARQQAFVANAAHELRSPLAGLQLRIEMLQRHGQAKPELAEHYLRQMEHEIEHLRRLVDHLLLLSRLDQGQELPRPPLDLAPLLYELADEMGPLVQVAGLHLHVDIPPHLPAVAANVDPMRMVMRNLLDNAIKYTPAGGRIVLRATAEGLQPGDQLMWHHEHADGVQMPRSPLVVSRSLHDTEKPAVLIQVADTGPGIAAEHLPHIFDRFYRVSTTRSHSQGGAGLGLSLVRSIVEAHGGQVEIHSVPGQGSTFTVRLPMTGNGADDQAAVNPVQAP
ncbi:MAG: ATP-binding protein [Anaerolineae bacterium]